MAANFDFNWLGFAFVSDSVPEREKIEKQLIDNWSITNIYLKEKSWHIKIV